MIFFQKQFFNFEQKIENENLSLFEQLKQANNLLEKINQVLKTKLDEINQLKLIEEKLCQKLDEKQIEFDSEGKRIIEIIYLILVLSYS